MIVTVKDGDEARVLDLFKRSIPSSGFDVPDIEERFALQSYRDILKQGYSLGYEEDGALVGVLILIECNFPWNETTTFLRNEGFFVLPEFRKTGAASKLLRAAKDSARAVGKQLFFHTNFDGNEAVDRFIERQGFKRLGSNFEMRT